MRNRKNRNKSGPAVIAYFGGDAARQRAEMRAASLRKNGRHAEVLTPAELADIYGQIIGTDPLKAGYGVTATHVVAVFE